MSWKTLVIMVATLLGVGGGGFGIARCATVSDVAAAEERVDRKVKKEKKEREEYDVKFDARLKVQEKTTTDLKGAVEEVQDVQHWTAADQAAERVSKKAPKHQREEVRMELFKRNLARLKSKPKKMPCMNLDCTN